MKVTPEQRNEWREKTANGSFNRWLDPQVRDSAGALDLDALYAVEGRYLPVSRERYAHLNPGQQRMNVGNRLRRIVPASEYEKSH